MKKTSEHKKYEIELGRELLRAYIGYTLGVSNATAKKYVKDDALVGNFWVELAQICNAARLEMLNGKC